MAVSILWNGVVYSVPDVGDESWGVSLSAYFVAIPQGALQKTGGSYTLSADVNFGANFGLLSKYYTTRTANPSVAGNFRLAKTDTVSWRNNANGADLTLGINGSDQLTFNGSVIEAVFTIGALDAAAANAQGLAFTGTVLSQQSADATHPGLVNNTSQTLSGAKTFSTAPILSSLTASTALVLDGSKNIASLAYASANTVSTLVERDSSGNFSAGTITASLTGVASGNTTITPNQYGVVLSGSANVLSVLAPDASLTKVLKSGGASANPSWLAYDNANTVSTLVFRDGSGNFSAGTITASLTGVASGNITAASVATANGFAGTSSGGATPILTLTTSVNAPVLSGNGTAIAAATTTGSGSTVVLSSGPTMTSPIVGTQSQFDGSTKAASTSYVDTAVANAVAGVNPSVAVQAATTAASDTSGFTYANGASGIGATLTGPSSALVVDGYTFTALGQRLLVKNDTQSPSGAFNGIYYVTQIQTGVLPLILTRALDYDQPSDINNTGSIPVVNGTVNGTTSWVQTAQVVTVGTTPLVFVQFTQNPANYLLKANNLSDVSTKATAFNNLSPMTTGGDLIYGGASGAGTRLANGSAGQFLVSAGTTLAPVWTTTLPIANGGTNVTSVTIAPTATAFAGWDANSNLSANAFISGLTSTATAGSTTTMTIASTETQIWTGSLTQTVKLPTTGVAAGATYFFVNLSSGTVTVQSSGANTVQVMATNSFSIFTALSATPTTAAAWNPSYAVNNAGGGTVTSVAAAGPTGIATWSSAVTTTGTLTQTLSTQSANLILAGPTTGSAATPTFRALVNADLPTIRSEARLDTIGGTGGTNTAIFYFTTTTTNTGSDITVVANDSTNGSSFTAVTAGLYAVTFAFNSSGTGNPFGISVNSNQLTTNIQSITLANRAVMSFTGLSANIGTVASTIVTLAANDVVRAHSGGTGVGASAGVMFKMTKIGN